VEGEARLKEKLKAIGIEVESIHADCKHLLVVASVPILTSDKVFSTIFALDSLGYRLAAWVAYPRPGKLSLQLMMVLEEVRRREG